MAGHDREEHSSIEEQTKPVPKRWHRSFRPVYLMLAVATLILGLLVYVVYRNRTAPLPPIQIAVATSLSHLNGSPPSLNWIRRYDFFTEKSVRGKVRN